jgi:hypothetical protein
MYILHVLTGFGILTFLFLFLFFYFLFFGKKMGGVAVCALSESAAVGLRGMCVIIAGGWFKTEHTAAANPSRKMRSKGLILVDHMREMDKWMDGWILVDGWILGVQERVVDGM